MKILIVTGIFPPDHGGPASYVPAIAAALGQRHSILGVVTLSDRLDHDDTGYPFPVRRILRGQSRLFRVAQTIRTIRHLSRQADVIYLNGLVLEGVAACRFFANKPFVIKVVGDLVWEKARHSGVTNDNVDVFQNTSYGVWWDILKWLQNWYTRKADAVITPSCYLARIVGGWGIDDERTRVVYNAVDTGNLPAMEQEEQGYDLVSVGRLVGPKRVDGIIRVAAELGLHCIIVGDGPMREEWGHLARESGADVTFQGHVAASKVPDFIRRGKIFILNSVYEGLPHVVLEAKAAGVPVIATAVGGTPELIHDGEDGLLIDAWDTDALAQKIRYLLERPDERKRLGEAGRRQVMSFFSFGQMVAQTEQVLESACRHD